MKKFQTVRERKGIPIDWRKDTRVSEAKVCWSAEGWAWNWKGGLCRHPKISEFQSRNPGSWETLKDLVNTGSINQE